MILTDFSRALAQITDRAFRGVLLWGVGLSLGLLIALVYCVQWILPDTISLPFFGVIDWLSAALSGFALVSTLILSAFLMIPVASLFAGFFLDRIVNAVEAKHYVDKGPANSISVTDTLVDSTKFFCLLIFVNAVALIIYLLSTVLAPFIFWIVNGLLLGREYFQLVAMRRLGRKAANQLRKKYRFRIWVAGILMAIPLSVPILNLFVPVLGVATFTHMYHRLAPKDP